MFSSLGLFQTLPCPEKDHCDRPNCLFSHRPDLSQFPVTPVPVDVRRPSSESSPTGSKRSPASTRSSPASCIPAKRSVSSPLRAIAPSNGNPTSEPPTKFQRTGTPQRPVAVPTRAQSASVSPHYYRVFHTGTELCNRLACQYSRYPPRNHKLLCLSVRCVLSDRVRVIRSNLDLGYVEIVV